MVQNVTRHFALCLLSAFTPFCSAAVSSVPTESPQSSQLETLVFNGTYPAKRYEFTGGSARHLANEIMPIIAKDITRATVSEDVLLPTPTYNGFTIDITFNITINENSNVCEERHAILRVSPDDQGTHRRDIHVKIENGAIVGHSLSSLYWRNKYISLPVDSYSRRTALEKCQSFLSENFLWSEAANLDDYMDNIRRIVKLSNAIEQLPPSAITFSSPDNTACRYDKNKLLTIMRPTRIDRSETIIIPAEGEWSVFYRRGLHDDLKIDFTATLRADKTGHPLTLSIRCSQSLPLPAI
jgi:hypothetical protein